MAEAQPLSLLAVIVNYRTPDLVVDCPRSLQDADRPLTWR